MHDNLELFDRKNSIISSSNRSTDCVIKEMKKTKNNTKPNEIRYILTEGKHKPDRNNK